MVQQIYVNFLVTCKFTFTDGSWYMELAQVPITLKKCNTDKNQSLFKKYRTLLINAHLSKNIMSNNKHGKNWLKIPNQSIEAPFRQLKSQKSSSA